MIATPAIQKEGKKKTALTKVPDYLVYEVSHGKPIYYKGYKEVLNGTKTFEEINMDSILQSWIKTRLAALLLAKLEEKGYDVLSGELGVNLSKSDKRGADIAIFREENLKLVPRYADIPPEIIIEVDVNADLEEMKQSELDYVKGKIDDYFQFGVQKVIWIFTANKLVVEATHVKPWLMKDWSSDILVTEGIVINIEKLIGKRLGTL